MPEAFGFQHFPQIYFVLSILLYNIFYPFLVTARSSSPWPQLRQIVLEWCLVHSSFEWLGRAPPLCIAAVQVHSAIQLEKEEELDKLLEDGGKCLEKIP